MSDVQFLNYGQKGPMLNPKSILRSTGVNNGNWLIFFKMVSKCSSCENIYKIK